MKPEMLCVSKYGPHEGFMKPEMLSVSKYGPHEGFMKPEKGRIPKSGPHDWHEAQKLNSSIDLPHVNFPHIHIATYNETTYNRTKDGDINQTIIHAQDLLQDSAIEKAPSFKKGGIMMAKSNESMGPGSNNLTNNTSVLFGLTDKSLAKPARFGLIGGLLWLVIMLFHTVNFSLAEPLESYPVFVVSDILNIVGAFLLFLFIRFLYNQGIHFGGKKLVFVILTGFALRVLGKIVDAFNYSLMDFNMGSESLITGLFLVSDLLHLAGAIAIAALMWILFKKEHKKGYKTICFLSVMFAIFHACGYIFLFLLDLGIIELVYIQITRSVSIITSFILILYFSLLLKDSKNLQRKTDNTLNF